MSRAPSCYPFPMRKRLPKKPRRGELTVLGFEVTARLNGFDSPADFDDFDDRFLEEAVEAHLLLFGGGGRQDRWSGIAYAPVPPGPPAGGHQRRAVVEWLEEDPAVASAEVSELFDLHHDPVPSEVGGSWTSG